MWRQVEIEASLNHPPQRVFAVLADPVRWHEFAPAVERRHQITAGPVGIGTRWAATDRILGPFKVHFTDELAERETDRRVVWHSTAPWNSRVEYICEPIGRGTRVVARYEGDVAGWLRLVALLPTAVLAWILRRDFHGLRALLDAEVDGGTGA